MSFFPFGFLFYHRRHVFIIILIIGNLLTFLFKFHSLFRVNVVVAIARASASMINLDTSLVLLTGCTHTMDWIKKSQLNYFLPFDDASIFHLMGGIMICISSIIHIAMHVLISIEISKMISYLFGNPTAISGFILILSLSSLLLFPLIKKRNWELFKMTHYFFLFLYVMIICVHGCFCLIHNLRLDCPIPTSIFYTFPFLTIWMLEYVYSSWKCNKFCYINKAIQHKCQVMEIQIKKPDCKWYEIGQYIKVCCPSISPWQWHPFSITSTPEESMISIHFRERGDWTREFAKRLRGEESKMPMPTGMSMSMGINKEMENDKIVKGIPSFIPMILISEPFGGLPCWIHKVQFMICIGAGIGQTPFIGILKSLWYRILHPMKRDSFHSLSLKKLLYIGISREMESFEWFHDIFQILENDDRIEFYCHVTETLNPDKIKYISCHRDNNYRDPITGLQKSRTIFGRPNIGEFLSRQQERFSSIFPFFNLWGNKGILYCGPEQLYQELYNYSSKFKYFYYREKF